MKIDKENLKLGMWYEDADGNVLKKDNPDAYEAPKGAICYHTIYPLQITETIRGLYDKNKKCKHKHTKRTYGWIDGLKGRQCCDCGRTQVVNKWRPWGKKWNNGANSYEMIEFHTHLCTDSGKCAVAMANSGDYTIEEALSILANACERCTNVLIFKYLNGQDGYQEFSEEWKKCNTVCDFCRDAQEESND